MKFFTPTITALSLSMIAGCASMTPTTEREEGYAIYHVAPGNAVSASDITDAIKTGLQQNMSEVSINTSIPPSPLPEEPARFSMVNPFQGSNLGALAAASGQSFSVPTCDQALMTANADDSSMSQYGENTTFFLCLQPYTDGYNIDIYTAFSKQSGGFSTATLGATLARSVVGDSSQFLPRTIDDIIGEVEETGAKVTLVETYP